MSEVQTRPAAPRGRTSSRGGRGFGTRGGRGGRATTNGGKTDHTADTSIDDSSEVGQLKKKYGTKVNTIKEMFPDWTDEDVVLALEETNGDLESTVDRITDGSITQWGEVSKAKKDRSKSKVKETVTTTLGDVSNQSKRTRGGRDAHESARGGRGRGSDRGRGTRGRGDKASHTNGTRGKESTELSIPTEDSTAWNTNGAKDNSDSWDTAAGAKNLEAVESSAAEPTSSWGASVAETVPAAVSSIIPSGVKKSWASMFAPAPAPTKKPSPPAAKTTPAVPVTEAEENKPIDLESEAGLPPPVADSPPKLEEASLVEPPLPEPEVAITPSKDALTESNVEQVLDASNPAPTATAASTAASSWDPRAGASSSTPFSALPGQQAGRPPTSGYAASALKATGASSRTPSYQRRVLDQEEAVRMPGHRDVDRAAVQFGAFNLSGGGDDDIDGEREDAETRTQPPQHSPVAPRASLPPAPLPTQQDSNLTPKEAPGLPAPQAAPGLPAPIAAAGLQNSQGNQQYSQYGRYAPTAGQESSSFGQKSYDPLSQQQSSNQNNLEGFSSQQGPQTQQSQAPQQSAQSGAFSSAPSEYAQYYTADQQRNYQNYYGQQYGQQQSGQAQTQQDGSATSAQRTFNGYNSSQSDSAAFPQTSGSTTQSRYATAGEAQNSGNNTPNPTSQAQQAGQSALGQQSHPQSQGQPGQYPYGHPYYSSPYYTAYINQYQQSGYGQGSYPGGPYGSKGNMYQGYPQAPYDHSASPATGGFGQSSLHGRDSGLAGALADYGRGGPQSNQTNQQLGGSGGFGGMQDAFGRNSSYQGQGQHYNQGQAQQGGADDLKPFGGDNKSASGPSPLLSQAARPGSAANTAAGQSGVLPPPQSSQQGYGGYPSHLQQQPGLHSNQTGSSYGNLSGIGGHQGSSQGQHQTNQYGGYGQGFGGNSYYGNNQRGGWGNNYGH